MQIATVSVSKRPHMWPYLIENISRQIRRPDLSILLIDKGEVASTNKWAEDIDSMEIIGSIIRNPDDNVTLGRLWGMAFEQAAYAMDEGLMCLMSDDDYYGDLYLHELEEFFATHKDAAIIGKSVYYSAWMGHTRDPITPSGNPNGQRVTNICGATISIPVNTWRKFPEFRFSETDWSGDISIKDSAIKLGLPIYSTTPYNFWYQRWPKGHGHAWNWEEDPK